MDPSHGSALPPPTLSSPSDPRTVIYQTEGELDSSPQLRGIESNEVSVFTAVHSRQ
jgi:hypothetical protein